MHKIVESENGSMSSTEALNLADNVDGCRLQLRTAQELIDRWLELGCLSQVRSDVSVHLVLFQRAPLEFRPGLAGTVGGAA